MDAELPEHAKKNREAWDRFATSHVEPGRRRRAADEPCWGLFSVPEFDLGVLPKSVEGMDVVELGCGTGYVSAWLARRGARPVGIDNSPVQLETARRFQAEFNVPFPLHLGNAEQTPFSDESFDLAISEYGASIWCDPYRWIPEAARILRPGGELIFLVSSTFAVLCLSADAPRSLVTDRLTRDYFGMHRFDWIDGSVEFHLGYGDWIRLLRANNFEIEDLIEVRPPLHATTRYPWMPAEWARRWPCEEIWRARRR